jgi:hypothetical protein
VVSRVQAVTGRSAPLLAVAAELAGSPSSEVEAMGALLLQLPEHFAGAVGVSSTLNNDGSPLQVCLTVSSRRRTVRLLADPGGDATSTTEQVARALGGLDVLLRSAREERRTLIAGLCSSILAGVVPPSVLAGTRDAGSVVWLGAALAGDGTTSDGRVPDRMAADGVAVYVRARWSDPTEDWDRCLGLTRELLPPASAAESTITALRDDAYPVSVGLETVGDGETRLKLYWRLLRPVMLSSLGIELLADASIADFLVSVVGSRPVAATGLIFSTSFSVASGQLTDVKVDVCGHCVRRPPEDWTSVVASLASDHGLVDPQLGRALDDRRADLALIGLGVDRWLEKRLNVYLKGGMATSPGVRFPTLLYRATCTKCRLVSAAIVVMSCRRIRRIPLDSPEALGLYARFAEPPGKLALAYRRRFQVGRGLPLSLLLALLGFARGRLAPGAEGGRISPAVRTGR